MVPIPEHHILNVLQEHWVCNGSVPRRARPAVGRCWLLLELLLLLLLRECLM